MPRLTADWSDDDVRAEVEFCAACGIDVGVTGVGVCDGVQVCAGVGVERIKASTLAVSNALSSDPGGAHKLQSKITNKPRINKFSKRYSFQILCIVASLLQM